MTAVLVLATRYDRASAYTYRWAEALHHDLLQQGHVCILLDGTTVCLGGQSLFDAVESAAVVVYYGHATADEWLALPDAPGGAAPKRVALMDAARLPSIAGKPVYAGCCHSLGGLGAAYGSLFPHSSHPDSGYVGYRDTFDFEFANERYFKDVVNLSVAALVNRDSAARVVADLKQAWTDLRDEFYVGRLKSVPNASQAGYLAEENSRWVDHEP